MIKEKIEKSKKIEHTLPIKINKYNKRLTINNKQIHTPVLKIADIPVLTSKMLATLLNTTDNNIRLIYNRHIGFFKKKDEEEPCLTDRLLGDYIRKVQ